VDSQQGFQQGFTSRSGRVATGSRMPTVRSGATSGRVVTGTRAFGPTAQSGRVVTGTRTAPSAFGVGSTYRSGRVATGTRVSGGGASTASHIHTGRVFYRSRHHDHHDAHHHHHHHGSRSNWWVGLWWDPWYYDVYSPFWYGGVPTFGYGVVVYESAYPVYVPVPEPVIVDPGVPSEGYYPPSAPVPPAAPIAPESDVPAPPTEEGAEDPAVAAARAEFQAALQAFLAGRYEEALGKFRAMTTADAKNGEAWLARAHSAFALGLYGESAHAVATAAALGAFPRGYRFEMAPLYPAKGSFEERLATLEGWTREHPDDADAQVVLAWLYVSLGRQAEARAVIAGIESIRPDDATATLFRVAMLPPEEPPVPPEGAAPAPPPR
jgi:hypothetical protein